MSARGAVTVAQTHLARGPVDALQGAARERNGVDTIERLVRKRVHNPSGLGACSAHTHLRLFQGRHHGARPNVRQGHEEMGVALRAQLSWSGRERLQA